LLLYYLGSFVSLFFFLGGGAFLPFKIIIKINNR
jgi:hypothetical protein